MLLNEAQELLHSRGWIDHNGGLDNLEKYLLWTLGSSYICLDGDFTVEELEAISVYIKNYNQQKA